MKVYSADIVETGRSYYNWKIVDEAQLEYDRIKHLCKISEFTHMEVARM